MLRRVWDNLKPRALFVMLNPSTADAEKDDPTIRSLYRICAALGFGGFEVVNLFAYRATDPKDLLGLGDELIGPRNDYCIDAAVGRCDLIVAAWGAHKIAAARAKVVLSAIRHDRPAVFCLGKTRDDSPKHPLYVKTGTQLEFYG